MAKSIRQGNVNKLVGNNSKVVSWKRGKRTVTRTAVYAHKKTGEVFEKSHTSTFDFAGLLKIVMILLLAAALFSMFTGSSDKTFYSFLVMLQDIPDVLPVDKLISFFSFEEFILSLPSWASFLEPILEFTSSLMTVFAFIIKGCISALQLIFYLVRWLFI